MKVEYIGECATSKSTNPGPYKISLTPFHLVDLFRALQLARLAFKLNRHFLETRDCHQSNIYLFSKASMKRHAKTYAGILSTMIHNTRNHASIVFMKDRNDQATQ